MMDARLPDMKRSVACVVTVASAFGCGAPTSSSTTDLPRDTVVATLLAVIGGTEGDPAYLFGDVSSVAVIPGGVLVADHLGSTVRTYDPAGSYVGTIGSQGARPGEFDFPNDLGAPRWFDALAATCPARGTDV
jgi:hypothetical protein